MQLLVLYRQAFLDEGERDKRLVENYLQPISKAWSENFSALFESLGDKISLFTNPELFGKAEELKKQKEFEKEADEMDIEKVLFDTLKVVPSEYIVGTEADSPLTARENNEFDEEITGWVDAKNALFRELRE